MVRVRCNHGWSRRGFALLWDVKALVELVEPSSVCSLRHFFALSRSCVAAPLRRVVRSVHGDRSRTRFTKARATSSEVGATRSSPVERASAIAAM